MHIKTFLAALLLAAATVSGSAMAEDTAAPQDAETHQYVIERVIPGAEKLSAEELKAISQKSRDVLEALGPEIEWQRSYVAEDRFYCVYKAPNKEIIRKHAEMGGFPADRISRVSAVIDPSTAD